MASLWAVALTAISGALQQAPAAQDYIFLEPVRTEEGGPLHMAGPDGDQLPVLTRAAETPLLVAARHALSGGFGAAIPAIDRHARREAAEKPSCPALPEAVFVYLSDEDGGFARQHFFYSAEEGVTPALCTDHFVDITIDEASIGNGAFEEVLAHEWGHVLLRRLLGPVPPVPSRKFHSVRTITDPVTAFDEGFGAHLQPLSARLTKTPGYRARIEGRAAPGLADRWISRQETWLRQAAVPQNIFVFARPERSLTGDPYAQWRADEAESGAGFCRLKSGDQMMAAEGVAAAFFHRLAAEVTEPEAAVEFYTKMILVLQAMGGWPEEAPLAAVAASWAQIFAEDEEMITTLFLETTHGATISSEAAGLAEEAACAASQGDIETFLSAREAAGAAKAGLLDDVLAGRQGLTAAIGPSLWIANPAVTIAPAPWQAARTLPATADLNTARTAELALLFEGTALAGKAARLTAARAAGPFSSLDDLAERAGLSEEEVSVLRSLAHAFERTGAAPRR
jgi:DNA uptake protein ComE-like DNA-binding protein